MIYMVINFALCLQSRGGIDNFCLFQITSFESCQVMFHLLFFEATKISYYFQAKTVQLIFLFLSLTKNERWNELDMSHMIQKTTAFIFLQRLTTLGTNSET